ncbi:uncharacterized protein LOC124776592 [Schistocerca piceifrons]|uniref:uncharacterized protein LOC124776592 n=1 Tax=Schistocerca piceifrons TaxID=274613 RepID=UPI001F5FDE29|nr:uncharacterized protein LOC124776592 [Schistocerca piceifrons]
MFLMCSKHVHEERETCGGIANNDFAGYFDSGSDSGSNVLPPVRKRCKWLVTEDDTDEEEQTYQQQSESWMRQTENNEPTIWTYMELCGIKEAALQHKLFVRDTFGGCQTRNVYIFNVNPNCS